MAKQAQSVQIEGCWISLILRVAMASLFAAAAIPKFAGGLDHVVTQFQSMFENTWLPLSLVTLYARVIPWIEILIPIWLLSGWRLRTAWFVTAGVLVSLAFGMIVTAQGAVAANNFFYVTMACAGLYFSQFDRWNHGE
ncbi:MAG: hypothetical protein COV74_10535 [Candidatus Omnitrophica bacterium CG11_big_fil_rev_8_21_14_0_20_45_26]|uniref:Methylamine utilisation protein MauE domain-containing protein n=1 Tax=Candidatus Abzuiibacterium crystallinum TaxID=1974748 RepID=A0A2H0LKZ7_9BACT|nr:MAG: hypothetical protein COV74_10535 [Candidatus Omnitrophica bacterium CG11_big_fil_rev_8_21_14_0_20_45_26]